MWPFDKQAHEARGLLDALLELHKHVDNAVAGGDMTEAERVLRHAVRVLEARAEG
jgi:hypothetical protein